jgi:ADP-ribosylglycohydrolase
MLKELISQRRLRVSPGAVESLHAPPALDFLAFDRVEGMLLGLAIGDALGNPTEGQLPHVRYPVSGYEPNRHANGRAVGLPSDDTQLAFWTLEHLLEHDRIVPERLLATFAKRSIFGLGHTVAAACRAYRDGLPWYEAAQHSRAMERS